VPCAPVRARREGARAVLDLALAIDDLGACEAAPEHPARLSGTVSVDGLAVAAALVDGDARLYVADPEVGMKRIEYRGRFCGGDGTRYRPFVRPRRAIVRSHRTGYARVCADDGSGRVVAAGVVVRRPWSLAATLASLRVEGTSSWRGLRHVLAFVRRETRTSVPAVAT
jgi:hypothetical protein